MRKLWKCKCGNTSNYERSDVERFITHQKHCIHCGGEMHVTVIPLVA